MSRIYGNIGFKGLWNGLPVRILMVRNTQTNSLSPLVFLLINVSGKDWHVDRLPMAHL